MDQYGEQHRGIRAAASRLAELAVVFSKLGCISFGGPVAHLGYFQAEFVQRRQWMSEESYADLVALCQFLPGPSSSQVVFGLGMLRAGVFGGLVASLCFMFPSLVLMILFGYGVATFEGAANAGWLHGLKLVATAVVVQAVWRMGRSLCPDPPRITIALATAAILAVLPGPLPQLILLGTGAVLGRMFLNRIGTGLDSAPPAVWQIHLGALSALGGFAALLFLLPLGSQLTGSHPLEVISAFYRSGALVFGGGHVVLPLLRAEMVPPGWISDHSFLAGYGLAQALPGPLFTFGGYLGTMMNLFSSRWMGGVCCAAALFAPAWLLVGGAIPYWEQLRSRPPVQASLRGANAVVVGVIVAALYHPIWSESVHSGRAFGAVTIAFLLVEVWKWPPWLVVAVGAVSGQWLLH